MSVYKHWKQPGQDGQKKFSKNKTGYVFQDCLFPHSFLLMTGDPGKRKEVQELPGDSDQAGI